MTAAILDFKAIKKRMQELDAPQAEPSLDAWRVELVDVKTMTAGDMITFTVGAGGWATPCSTITFDPKG